MAVPADKQTAAGSRRAKGPAGDPILAAKITAPDVPDWALPRPRITKLIAEGTRWCPLTVVTGPPGAGKTMALALWAAAEPGPVAWLSVDEYDNRPGAFWAYVVAALRQSGVALPKTMSTGARGRAEHMFLLRLASALAALDPPVTLVLDDFHLITEPKVLSALDFVVRNVGPGLRVVACSPMDPPLPLHRYRLAGELADIRAADLAFTTAEAGLLVAQHGSSLSAVSLESLTRRTEGWAAGIRLAAISMDSHPDPDQFVKELTTEDSALTSYLVEEALSTQPPEARDLLLRTSILDHVNAALAGELTGSDKAAGILAGLAHTNAFVRPIGGGWYRYHTLLAEVLRLKLRHGSADRVPDLHRRAARWHQRTGHLRDAVRHAARAGDWQLAASLVIDGLAISEIIEPGPGRSLAQEFAGMPPPAAGDGPRPYLISAAVALATHRADSWAPALATAEAVMENLPAGQEATARLAAAMLRLAASRRTGDLAAAETAMLSAEALAGQLPGGTRAHHPEIRARLLAARGAVQLWSGQFDEAARVLESGVAAAATPGGDRDRAACLGQLALVEALRGRLRRAEELAVQATAAPGAREPGPPAQDPNQAALVALAWLHLERGELRETASLLKQVSAALRGSPDKLLGALACLAAARGYLADGHAAAAAQYLATARSGWSVPAWLEQRLTQAASRGPGAAAGVQQHQAQARRRDHPPARRHSQRPAPLSGPAQATAPLVVEPLTEREQEVLRHLSQLLSTAEVASEMYISTNTVKSHLKSVFRKLGAAHRGEAVRRARQLELI
jgi:ATP/maltotriose-dependent transcriptional regulator MalT